MGNRLVAVWWLTVWGYEYVKPFLCGGGRITARNLIHKQMKKKSEVILDKIEIRLAQIIFYKQDNELIHQFERSIARSVMNDRKITEDIQDEFLGDVPPEEPPKEMRSHH